MGLHWQFGVVQGASGNPALGISIVNNGITSFTAEGIAGEGDFPIETNNGAIDFTATATGGDGSYTFLWTVTEAGDDNNIASGNIQQSAGTATSDRNAAQYNKCRIKFFDTGLEGGETIEASYRFACTVTDGTGATATHTGGPGRVVATLLAQG